VLDPFLLSRGKKSHTTKPCSSGSAFAKDKSHAMPSYTLHAPSDLTSSQKSDLERLWEVQTRKIPDVRPTSESSEDSNNPNTPTLNDRLTCKMMTRLHSFFLAFLRNVDLDSIEEHAFLKDVRESCLEPYARLFLVPQRELKLRAGRRMFTLHYDEFLSELNRFEFRGDVPPEILRKESFGAFLHFFPIQALPALNVAMALAVATLWRSKQEEQAEGEVLEPSNKENCNPLFKPARLEHFLDNCQVVVRFIHVTPQLPMADIKTGLVHKFISVKGHVVKARPKRLRVATADFACQKCTATITHSFYQGRFSLPSKCHSLNCRSRSFTLIRPTARCVSTNWI